MKRTLSFILTLVLLIGLMPMQAFATEATGNADDAEILRQLARETSFPLGNISGNIAVLGDSTISGYPKYSALSTYFSVADGYTITDISKAGDTIVGQLNKWKALSVTEKSALNYVFVQIGLNDTDETAETFRAQYTSLIAQIRADAPDAMLILGTMVPCKQRWKVLYPNTWEEHQERWEIANEDIQNGYYDCDSVAYLHTEALGLDGNLRKEYNHGDHIHENAEGAKVIAYSWYLAAFGHSHRYSSIVTSPTCTEQGYTTYTCECGDSYVDDYLPLLPHTYKAKVTDPTCTEQGYTTHTCTGCGDSCVSNYVDATGHTYENGVCIGCGQLNDYDGHLQQLPESLCGGMNLWPMLRHDSDYYYAGTHWGKLNDVHSVTIPIKPGDKLVATSFAKGIRVAYFDNSGLLISVPSEQVKSEFSANGFLLVPDGAVAVNIPMWDNSATNELYISSRSHSFEEDRCSICQYQRMQVTAKDMAQTVGAVYASDGTYNASYTNNWFADIPIPNGAEQIRVLTFKTGAGCGSVFFGAGKYISGYADTEIGGQWITLDIPVGADTFRYCYLTDTVAQQNDVPLFEYVEFLGKKMGPLEKPPFAYRPSTGCHSFSVEVNIAPAQGNPDGYITGTDYGYIQLPTNYNPYGEPTRLIIVCHGAGASLTTYQSDEWKDTNYSFWTDLGYAVMDMYACPTELTGSNSALHYGNPIVLDCYKAGYDYVMKNFNLKQDGIYVIGSSMGGLSSFQIVQSGQFPVLAQVAYCPVIDLFKQAYCNPWTTASYQRSRISSYFGFTGTLPVFTNGKFPSSEEIAFYKQNLDKTIAYSPILHNLVAGDVSTIFDVVPTSATATNDAEAAIYGQFTATHPCPLIIFHNTDDSTVSYRYSQYFVDMLKQSGQNATLYTFTSGGHNAWANGQNFALEGINGDITIKESQYEAYLFFSKLENHKEHYPWIDPAVAPTCTETGLTEGSHCAFCGEVLKAQETVAALTHTYTSVATPPTCTEKGYTTYTCECGDSYVDDYMDATGHTYKNGICTGCGATQPGPIITQQPTNDEAKLGENFIVEVKAEGENLKYQWYFRNAGSSKWYKSSVKDNTYDDVMTKSRAGREIYCVITDANGNSVTTDTVKLIRVAAEELKITAQPDDSIAAFGEMFCATVEAQGEGIKYQWYFRNAGSEKWYKSSVKDDTYDDVMTPKRAGREIYCVITDALGNKVTTDIVTLIAIQKTPLKLLTQPESTCTKIGDDFCVTVEAEGDFLKYQWYFRNAGSDKWYKSSVKDNSYDDVMTKARANREIYCVITDASGNKITTDIVTLVAIPQTSLKLLAQAENTYTKMGEDFCVTVEAEGDLLEYQWYFRNAGSDKWYKSSVKDNTYDDVMTKSRANREVYCVITDAYGNKLITEVVTIRLDESN